jgi:hypothetical protein
LEFVLFILKTVPIPNNNNENFIKLIAQRKLWMI